MNKTFIVLFASASLLSFGVHAQAIKNDHNAFACVAVDSASNTKSFISFVEGDDHVRRIGVNEYLRKADKDIFRIVNSSEDVTTMTLNLVESMEQEINGTLKINKKTGVATLSKNLAYNSEYRLFNLTNFSCRSTVFKKNTPRDRFKAIEFLKSAGLPGADTSIRYRNVACSEFDFDCDIKIE